MSDWRTVSIKMKDDQVAALNLRLKQLGYETMGDLARALTDGVVSNQLLVDDLADAIASKLVVKMTTMQPVPRVQTPTFEREKEPRAGFDPTTYCLQGSCSTRLSYRGLLSDGS